MYGTDKLPEVEISEEYRYEGSIWCGAPESTWFKTVKIPEDVTVKQGIIVKEDPVTGIFNAISAEDIITAPHSLPGARLGIVADKVAKGSVLIGIQGQVDKNKLLVEETAFSELSETQKINLNTQLEAWSFQLIDVKQR